MLVPFLVIALLPFIPESPRWYIQHGYPISRARASLTRVRATPQDVEHETLLIREALTFEANVLSSPVGISIVFPLLLFIFFYKPS